MKRSTHRILTTHTGSIARPDDLLEVMRDKENDRPYDKAWLDGRVHQAVIDAVHEQCDCGIDVIGDGEQGKSGFTSYQLERLSGFETLPPAERPMSRFKEVQVFPEYYERYMKTNMFGAMLAPQKTVVCRGPVTYIGREALETDLANLKAGLEGQKYEEAFVSAANPANLVDQRNEYYKTQEEFLTALCDAMHQEYQAIIDAGYIIQMDDPSAANLWGYAAQPAEERAKNIDARVETINYALKGIPEDKIRYHTCYSINQGPHIFDLHLRDFVGPMLRVNAQAISFEVMNPRHMHDYHTFEDVKLPEGKIIIPGMLSHGANWVEHPELIAELTVNYAKLVGRENVMLGNDCGFASQAGAREV
ncbi:MAG TPA: methionine synthase, partial [Dehalococcoidia bacterium]|nr:methionine synthase [Dehalococcoidia bacterium]